MKPELTITKEPDGFKATITNGSISPVHIEGCESEEVAQKEAGIIKEVTNGQY